MSDPRQQLQQVYQLIRSGQKQQAIQMLLPILKADRDNADAWWLMANAVSDNPERARQALENVLRLRPDHAQAQQMLSRLGGSSAAPASSPPAASPGFGAPPTSNLPSSSSDPFAGLSGAPSSPPPASSDPFAGLSDPFAGQPSSPPPPASPDPFAGMGDPFAGMGGQPSQPNPFGGQPSNMPYGGQPSNVPYGGQPMYGSQQGFSPMPNVAPMPVVPANIPRRGTSPCVIALAVIGLLACGICAVVAISGGAIAKQFASSFPALATQLQGTMTAQGFDINNIGSTIQAALTITPGAGSSGDGSLLPSQVTMRGTIEQGQSKEGVVDTFTPDGYTLAGTAGQTVTIEVDARDNTLDPKLQVYGPDNRQIAQNDDINIGTNNNSRVTITLPTTGTYTLVISAFGSGGKYQITVG